jgi:DNA-binding transcriptional LysR family regulator
MMFNITMGDVTAQPVRDDLNQLWVLAALGKTKRVEHAAQLLGMTQPGVSNALRRLRQRFGDPLLVRTRRGMEPTPRGQQLIDAAQTLVEEYEARVIAASPFDPATSVTEFRVALSDIGEMAFLPRILDYLRLHAPRTSVRSVNLRPRALAEALEDGEVDLAIGYFPDVKGNGYFQQRLFSSGFVCLVRGDHPKVGSTLTRADFLTLGHAVVQAEGRSQEMFEEYLRKHGIQRRVVLHVPHFMSIPLVIAKSDLVVTVPRALGSAFASLSPLKLVKPPFALPQFPLKQHWHRRFHKDARNIWLRAMIMTLFNRD